MKNDNWLEEQYGSNWIALFEALKADLWRSAMALQANELKDNSAILKLIEEANSADPANMTDELDIWLCNKCDHTQGQHRADAIFCLGAFRSQLIVANLLENKKILASDLG